MDTPFTRFYCDVCGKPIDDLKRGYVIWKSDDTGHDHSFKIIHQRDCDQKDHAMSQSLADFLGPDGLQHLLSMLSYGPLSPSRTKAPGVRDLDEWVDFVRRLQTPHYEEARRRFGEHDVRSYWADANQVRPYIVDALRSTIDMPTP